MRKTKGLRGRLNWFARPIVLVGLTVLSACSMVQVGYSMAPTMINWELSRYVTFDAGQQGLVDKHLEAVHEWHRDSQLPAYAALLERVSDRLSDGLPIQASELTQLRQDVFKLWEPMALRIAPAVTEVVLSMRPEQFDEIEAYQQSRYEKRQTESAGKSAKQRQLDRRERWEDSLSFFLGDLSELQQARLAQGLEQLPKVGQWRERRRERQRQTVAMLRSLSQDKADSTVANQMVQDWLLGRLNGWQSQSADSKRFLRMMSESDELTAKLLNLASPAQLAHAREVIDDLAQDLRSASGRPAPRAQNMLRLAELLLATDLSAATPQARSSQ